MSNSHQLDQLCINTIRMLSADGVQKANSGHPGLPMGCASIAYVIWTRHLKHNPGNPQWIDRDRFVLSAGHGSMLLYSLLHLTGYDLPLSELQNFRQWGSKTPGHPEHGRPVAGAVFQLCPGLRQVQLGQLQLHEHHRLFVCDRQRAQRLLLFEQGGVRRAAMLLEKAVLFERELVELVTEILVLLQGLHWSHWREQRREWVPAPAAG